MTRRLICLALPLFLFAAAVSAGAPSITLRGLSIDHSPFTLVAMPGEALAIGTQDSFGISMDNRPLGIRSAGAWTFDAPLQPGHYKLSVNDDNGSELLLNLFVMVPAGSVRNDTLNGYRIGPAPAGLGKYPALYQPPGGFIEVTEELLDLPLSPHFRLRQFLCKQQSGFPKYIALKEPLLLLLEGLLGAVRRHGFPATTFGVISGYRTPWYNKKIGNVPNSRHVYGDAMDLFVDVDGDGRMDDLNGDGLHDLSDVNLLGDIAERFMTSPAAGTIRGGIGRYRKTGQHDGFIHVDTRGYDARW